MNSKLKTMFTNIIEKQQGLCLDNPPEREKLINLLTEAFTPKDFIDVATISEAIFPKGEVNETMMECELTINTGLYNVASAGDEPVLDEIDDPSSREIFSATDTLFCIYGDQDD